MVSRKSSEECEKCGGPASVLCAACNLCACLDCITLVHEDIDGGTNHSMLPCPKSTANFTQPECVAHMLPITWFDPSSLTTGCAQCQVYDGEKLESRVITLKNLQEQLDVAGSIKKFLHEVKTTVDKIRRIQAKLSDEEEVELLEKKLAQVASSQEAIVNAGRGGRRILLVIELTRMIKSVMEELDQQSTGLLDEVCLLATSVEELIGPTCLVTGDLVQLGGVLGPHFFYITRIQDEGLLATVSLALQKVWDMGNDHPLILGGCAIMQEDDLYYRVRVEEVEIGERVRVVFLDKVGEGVVAARSLVALGKGGPGSWPPLVQPASLPNLPHGHLWGKEATLEIDRFGRGPCVVEVLEKSGSKMVVELIRPVNKRVPGDFAISLSAFLVNCGQLPAKEEAMLEGLHCPPYMRRPPMSLNAELDVVVTQVDSGNQIWVQETDNSHLMETVDQILQKEYSLAWDDSDLEVLVPFPRLRCITRCEGGVLKRAVVTKVNPDGGLVEVCFVDSGVREWKPPGELKKTLDVALVTPVLAVAVCMADIIPKLGEWREEEIESLRQLLINRCFTMFVESKSEGERLARVVLYERGQQRDVSLNSLAVERGLALSSTCALPSVNFSKPRLPNFTLSTPSPLLVSSDALSTCILVPGAPVSPHYLQVQPLQQRACAQQLEAALFASFDGTKVEEVKGVWKKGDGCVAKVGKIWVRGRVEHVEGEKQALIYLPDFGTRHAVQIGVMHRLWPKFQGPPLSTTIHLPNVLPMAGRAWSLDTCRHLEEFLSGKKMEVKALGPAVPLGNGRTSMPAKVMVARTTGLPTSLGDLLIVWGVARIGVFNPELREGYEESGVQYEDDQISGTQDITAELSAWLPPRRPTTQNFTAVCRHVDWEGRLYVTLTSNLYTADVLRLISLVLNVKYHGSRPRPTDKYWRPGDLCIAQWSEDRRWYRGEVLATDLEGENLLAHVCFVDYGTDQWCEASHELRKELFMKEQPVQALPILLQGVSPKDDVWTEAELNFLHETLVDKVVKVEVDHLDQLPLQGKVTCDGKDVGEILHHTFFD